MRIWTGGKVVLPVAVFSAVIMLIVALDRDPRASTTQPVVQVGAPSTSATPPPTTSPLSAEPADPASTPVERDDFAERVRELVREKVPAADVGVEVYDRQSSVVLTRLNADRQFFSMSVVKLLIALDVLRSGSSGRSELTRMITASDDDIASSLWVQQGGTAIITRMVALLGLSDTEPPSAPGQWGSTRISARDMVKVYRYIEESLPAADRDLLYSAMYHASENGSDGTNQYFGIPDGLPGTTWAIKQGWGTSGTQAVYNTTGLIGTDARYIVIVLSSAPSRYYRTLASALTAGTTALGPLLQ